MSAAITPKSIWFPEWSTALATLRISDLERAVYRRALSAYLRFCKETCQRATVLSARQFMAKITEQRRLGVSQLASWKTALKWFFKAGAQKGTKDDYPIPYGFQQGDELFIFEGKASPDKKRFGFRRRVAPKNKEGRRGCLHVQTASPLS